ncbi:MAG TPA: ribosome-associated translation inhibitor RaiA [Acidobacteriota bacterium]|nr:ribosome-associated translation inhibitor RaiA [Acidobacteriota bacterium]
MNISYTTRGCELNGQIKKYTEEKLKKIFSLDELLEVNLTLVQMRHRYKAELMVHNRTARFNAIEETSDVFKSINAAVDKIQKQIKRHKEKLVNRKRFVRPKTKALVENLALGETLTMPRVVRARKQDIKPMSQEEAVMQLEARRDGFLVFRNVSSDRINVLYRRKDGNYGLIDSEIQD